MLLVLGAGGQLGRELAEAAAEDGVPLIGKDSTTDITSAGLVADAMASANATVVVNAAAYTNVDRAEAEPAAAARVNETGAGIVAAECARLDIPLIHLSTDYVFDGEKGSPYTENDAPKPLSVYGRTKLAGEAAVRDTARRHLILRSGWLFGPYGNNFVTRFLPRVETGEALRVVSDRYGSPTAASDLARAILIAAARLGSGKSAAYGTYHVGGPERTTWHALALEVLNMRARLTGKTATVEPIAADAYRSAAARPRDASLASDRFVGEFGFRCGPWQAGVERAVKRLLLPQG